MSSATANDRSVLSQGLKTGLYSLVVCTFLVLSLALVIRLFSIPQDAIPLINQIIKVVSVAVGTLICVRDGKGLLKGALGGILFAGVSTALFALLGGTFSFPHVLLDVLCALLIGAVVGLFAGKRSTR